MLQNLLDGTTPPWNVRVSTMHELCRVFRGKLHPKDFYRPRQLRRVVSVETVATA